MILITEQIPEQSFELITKQLGAILLLELDNQNKMSCSKYDIQTFLERTIPIDKSEDVVVNISLNSVNYDEHNEFSVQGSHNFNIDVYTFSDDNIYNTADENSRIKLHRVVGWIRYILSSTKYKYLNINNDACHISGSYLQSINFDDNFGNQDASMSRMCRIVFNVRADENQDPDQATDFTINETNFKISNTEKGYKLIFNT